MPQSAWGHSCLGELPHPRLKSSPVSFHSLSHHLYPYLILIKRHKTWYESTLGFIRMLSYSEFSQIEVQSESATKIHNLQVPPLLSFHFTFCSDLAMIKSRRSKFKKLFENISCPKETLAWHLLESRTLCIFVSSSKYLVSLIIRRRLTCAVIIRAWWVLSSMY